VNQQPPLDLLNDSHQVNSHQKTKNSFPNEEGGAKLLLGSIMEGSVFTPHLIAESIVSEATV
jgi:hypothetical protein